MTSTTTETDIPPLTGISESERDKYLLIATFLSVLIVFGVIIAIMHRKCRDTLSRSKSWIISKTVRNVYRRPNINQTTSSGSRSVEVNIRDPSSPIFSKEVNAPVMFHLGSSEETSSSGRTRKEKRVRSYGTDHEDDSGISVISGQNIPMCSMSNKCFSVNRDVNDNVTLTYNPSSISLDPDVNLVRVLAPEMSGISTATNDNSRRPQLRRSSTVIDKMNFLQGYMPSSRDEDFTVVTLTDDSEPEYSALDISQTKHFQKTSKKQYPRYSEGLDNPAFYLKEILRSKSDYELYEENRTSKSGLYNDNVGDKDRNSKHMTQHHYHVAEVHEPNKIKTEHNVCKKSPHNRNYKRPHTQKIKNKPKSIYIDKESQELYNRVMCERIHDIIQSDSSSVNSDQTFARSNRKKKRKLQNIP